MVGRKGPEVSRGLWSEGGGDGGFQAGGVCEGRPRGFWRPVRDVRTVSGPEVCREDRKEAASVEAGQVGHVQEGHVKGEGRYLSG